MMKNLLQNKKGTAEVIGTVMFIVILLFFFTNVYLWHDAATKEMNELQVRNMNAGMEVNYLDGSATITAKGSDVFLSRIWIITTNNQHFYANLENLNIHLVPGNTVPISLASIQTLADGSIKAEGNADGIRIYYDSNILKISVLNTLGILVTS
jgi:hypothetical protein